MNMNMDDHFHPESLEEFTQGLAAAGFELVAGSNPPRWRGAIHPAFASLTDATTMDVLMVPGWPFQPPAVFVDGLHTSHSTLGGFVCLWREGDGSLEWTTVAGLFSRIEEWCENAGRGWEKDHLDQDAFLNFQRKSSLVATFDLPELGAHEGGWGDFCGIVNPNPRRLDIAPGRRRSTNQLRGLWFHVGPLKTPPPRHLSEVHGLLSRQQRKGLTKALSERRKPEPLAVSGGLDLILFCWEREGVPDLLTMACEGTGEKVEAIALQPGPRDANSLALRAGPDAPDLRDRTVALFGCGALGGHAAVLLAESGVGALKIIDPDMLLPGNVVRHVAGHSYVGLPKTRAVQAVISDHAPWTEVSCFEEAPRTPGEIRNRIDCADIVIDATGNEALTGSLAMVAENLGKPLVSGALYRGGSVGRAQRQALPDDTPIHGRDDLTRYPLIPAGMDEEEFARPQLGCSASVNNAPPSTVMGCAALIAEMALDAITERFQYDDEVIDVYRRIPDQPFNRVGRVVRGAM